MKHKRVLSWVNRIRKEHFGKGPLKRLPKGYQCDSKDCPIHNCFWETDSGGWVKKNYMRWISNDSPYRYRSLALPKLVHKFVHEFDNGKYPELIKK